MMAADAFAMANTASTVGNPHDPHLAANRKNSSVFSELRQSTSGSSGTSLSSAAAIVLGLSNLGLNGRSDPTSTGGPSLQAIPFAKPFGQNGDAGSDKGSIQNGSINGGGAKKEDMVREKGLLHAKSAHS